jgi:hypothetical protein
VRRIQVIIIGHQFAGNASDRVFSIWPMWSFNICNHPGRVSTVTGWPGSMATRRPLQLALLLLITDRSFPVLLLNWFTKSFNYTFENIGITIGLDLDKYLNPEQREWWSELYRTNSGVIIQESRLGHTSPDLCWFEKENHTRVDRQRADSSRTYTTSSASPRGLRGETVSRT